MAPCGAGNLFDWEGRAKIRQEHCVGAESMRLVALVTRVKLRWANEEACLLSLLDPPL